jgi:hypothetical protein
MSALAGINVSHGTHCDAPQPAYIPDQQHAPPKRGQLVTCAQLFRLDNDQMQDLNLSVLLDTGGQAAGNWNVTVNPTS